MGYGDQVEELSELVQEAVARMDVSKIVGFVIDKVNEYNQEVNGEPLFDEDKSAPFNLSGFYFRDLCRAMIENFTELYLGSEALLDDRTKVPNVVGDCVYACNPIVNGKLDDRLVIARTTNLPEEVNRMLRRKKEIHEETHPEVKIFENCHVEYEWNNVAVYKLTELGE
jgi:hypothetical protein